MIVRTFVSLLTFVSISTTSFAGNSTECDGASAQFAVGASATTPLGSGKPAELPEALHTEISDPIIPTAGVSSVGDRLGEAPPEKPYKVSVGELPPSGTNSLSAGFFSSCSFKGEGKNCASAKWNSAISE